MAVPPLVSVEQCCKQPSDNSTPVVRSCTIETDEQVKPSLASTRCKI